MIPFFQWRIWIKPSFLLQQKDKNFIDSPSVGVCYIFWWMNLIFIMLRIELQNKKNNLSPSPPHHQDIRRPSNLEVSFATWKSESFKGSSQTTHLSGAWVDSTVFLVFRKKNKVNSWGSVSIICMYIDPLKKLRVSKAQKMCSANSFVDQGRFAGHILEWHILPKHVFFELLDDPWPSCGDGTY